MTMHTGDRRRIDAQHLADVHDIAARAQQAEEDLYEGIRDARAQGVTWELLGRALGVSRSAAQQRFSKPPPGRLLNED
jgi:hypothetical protein